MVSFLEGLGLSVPIGFSLPIVGCRLPEYRILGGLPFPS